MEEKAQNEGRNKKLADHVSIPTWQTQQGDRKSIEVIPSWSGHIQYSPPSSLTVALVVCFSSEDLIEASQVRHARLRVQQQMHEEVLQIKCAVQKTIIVGSQVVTGKAGLVIPVTPGTCGQSQSSNLFTEFCGCLLGGGCVTMQITSQFHIYLGANVTHTCWAPPLLQYKILLSNTEYKSIPIFSSHPRQGDLGTRCIFNLFS